VVPTGVVTSGMGVITAEISWSLSVSNRRSRLVRIPTSVPAASVMGTPEMWNRAIRSSASATGRSAVKVTGSEIMPDSERFTRSTS